MITVFGLEKAHSIRLVDLEGHGLSPTSADSLVSLSIYTEGVLALAEHSRLGDAIIIAHSLGCLIALKLAIERPELVSKLVLLGPLPSPFSDIVRERAQTVRRSGMSTVAEIFSSIGMFSKSKRETPLAVAAVGSSLLEQDTEGYAKGCIALGEATEALRVHEIKAKTMIITGDEDKVCSPEVFENYTGIILGLKVAVLPEVGHYHLLEDLEGVASAVVPFL